MKFFLLIGCAFAFAGPVSAQQDSWESYRQRQILSSESSLCVQIGMPTEKMQPAIRNNMFNKGIGISFQYLWNPGTWSKNKSNTPFRIGLDAGYTYYGRFKADGIKTSYAVVHLVAAARIRPPKPMRFTPFIELQAGGNFAIYTIKEDLDFLGSTIYDPAIFDERTSPSFVKGLAAGFFLGKMKTLLHVKFSFTKGSRIRYVVRNSVSGSGGYVTYETAHAPVEYFAITFGIGGFNQL